MAVDFAPPDSLRVFVVRRFDRHFGIHPRKGLVIMNKGLIIGGAVVGLLLIIIIGFVGCASSAKTDGVRMETSLNAQYLDNQNELSTYTSTFYETIGVANLKS